MLLSIIILELRDELIKWCNVLSQTYANLRGEVKSDERLGLVTEAVNCAVIEVCEVNFPFRWVRSLLYCALNILR